MEIYVCIFIVVCLMVASLLYKLAGIVLDMVEKIASRFIQVTLSFFAIAFLFGFINDSSLISSAMPPSISKEQPPKEKTIPEKDLIPIWADDGSLKGYLKKDDMMRHKENLPRSEQGVRYIEL